MSVEFKQTSDREVVIQRTFNAPRDMVWRAFTDAEWIAQWWGRGHGMTIEKCDVVRGGHWRYVEHAGDQDHGFEGRYGEVVPKERIMCTFEWDGMPGYPSREVVEFIEEGSATRVVTSVIFFTAEECAGMMGSGWEGGLTQSYEALDRLLARVGAAA